MTFADLTQIRLPYLCTTHDGQAGGWGGNNDERLIRSIAIDVESLPD